MSAVSGATQATAHNAALMTEDIINVAFRGVLLRLNSHRRHQLRARRRDRPQPDPKAYEKAIKKFRDEFGHTPLPIEEPIPWDCRRPVIGTGTGGLSVMDEVTREVNGQIGECE